MTTKRVAIKTTLDGAAVALISAGVGIVTANLENNSRLILGAFIVALGLVVVMVRQIWNEGDKAKPAVSAIQRDKSLESVAHPRQKKVAKKVVKDTTKDNVEEELAMALKLRDENMKKAEESLDEFVKAKAKELNEKKDE